MYFPINFSGHPLLSMLPQIGPPVCNRLQVNSLGFAGRFAPSLVGNMLNSAHQFSILYINAFQELTILLETFSLYLCTIRHSNGYCCTRIGNTLCVTGRTHYTMVGETLFFSRLRCMVFVILDTVHFHLSHNISLKCFTVFCFPP